MSFRLGWCISGAAAIAASTAPALSAENGVGFYLLGQKTAGAGLTPPSGTYLANLLYAYSGNASAAVELPLGNQVAVGIDAKAAFDGVSVLWVAPQDVMGAKFGASFTVLGGWQKVHAFVQPGSIEVTDSIATFGDPIFNALLGGEGGNYHWQTLLTVNIPIGNYDPDSVANLAFHRWAADVSAALTWLDPMTGWELSGTAGFTFNGTNPETDYRTGTEFHLEGAVVRHFSKEWSAGAVGYYYNQVSGDSGSGATLGPFKGRVGGLGLTLGYSTMLGTHPVSGNVTYFHEFGAKNRLSSGNAVLVTMATPLAAPH